MLVSNGDQFIFESVILGITYGRVLSNERWAGKTFSVLFLYRHSIEMLIKSLLPGEQNTHSLVRLMALYQEHVRSKYSCKTPRWISARIKEIDEVDPGSTAFRYAENRDKISKEYISVEGEIHVYLDNIQTVVRVLHSALNDAPRFRTEYHGNRKLSS